MPGHQEALVPMTGSRDQASRYYANSPDNSGEWAGLGSIDLTQPLEFTGNMVRKKRFGQGQVTKSGRVRSQFHI